MDTAHWMNQLNKLMSLENEILATSNSQELVDMCRSINNTTPIPYCNIADFVLFELRRGHKSEDVILYLKHYQESPSLFHPMHKGNFSAIVHLIKYNMEG